MTGVPIQLTEDPFRLTAAGDRDGPAADGASVRGAWRDHPG